MRDYEVDYGSLLDRLLSLGDQHRTSGYDMAGHDLRASLFILGWFQRIRRSVRAVRVLVESGYAHEAAPLMRTLVEYGVAMKLISDEPHRGVDIFISKMQETIRRWSENFAEGDEVPSDMEAILTWETDKESESMRRLLAFKQLCKEWNEMEFYQYWWKLLPYCHASYEGSMTYIGGDPPDYLILDQAVDEETVRPLVICTAVLFMACDTVHSFMPEGPWQTELDAVAAELYQDW